MSTLGAECHFSPDRVYRYTWTLWWDRALALFYCVLCNPSTADEDVLDPTVSKMCVLARALGYGGLCVLNAYALRSTDPVRLKQVADPVGPENDYVLQSMSGEGDILCGWGKNAASRTGRILELLEGRRLLMLKLNKDGTPTHPLYLPKALRPQLWRDGWIRPSQSTPRLL